MRILGSPSEEDYEWYKNHVPYKAEVFDEINYYETACLEDIFFRFQDIRNLVDLLRFFEKCLII